MTGKAIYRYELTCDGCAAKLGDKGEYGSAIEARAAAYDIADGRRHFTILSEVLAYVGAGAQQTTPPAGKRDTMTDQGTQLNERDPEPGLGCVVATVDGVEWEHVEGTYGRDYWVRVDDPAGDPESWIKVAGNYGPVRLVRSA